MKSKSPPSDLVSLIAAIILALVGLGLIAGAIVQVLPIARARIQLERDPVHGVTGSFSYVLFGMPIFWLSLDGLHHLENQDFTRYHMVSNRYRGTETIYRLGFVNGHGETLAWSERGSVMNNSDMIRHFLSGDVDRVDFQQEAAFQVTFDDIQRGVLAVVLVFGAALLIWMGARGVFHALFEVKGMKQNTEADFSDRTRLSVRRSSSPP